MKEQIVTPENFGDCLRTYRREHFLTQEQLAGLLGLSVNHIHTLESGKKRPRPSTMAAFSKLCRGDVRKADGASAESSDEAPEELYARLWCALKRLEPHKEKELVDVFMRIIDWM